MDQEKKRIIAEAWSAFSGFARPERLFANADFEEGELEEMLAKTRREELSAGQAGTAAWGPLPLLTPEALAHFAPRVIELAMSGVNDKDGAPFFCLFVDGFHEGPEGPRFRLFGPEQRRAVAAAFDFLCIRFGKELDREGRWAEAEQGALRWGRAAPGAKQAPPPRGRQ